MLVVMIGEKLSMISSWRIEPLRILLGSRRRSLCSPVVVSRLLPNCSSAPVRNEEVAEFNRHVMAKAKAYADGKRKVLASSLSVGDTVLIRQQKRNKLTSFFGPKPCKVVAIKGSMISARRGDRIVVRNSSFFKRVRLQGLKLVDGKV